MRIAVAGISHESLNFSPVTVSLEEFRVWRGEELLQGGQPVCAYEAGVSGKGKYSPSYATLAEMMQDLGVEAAPILHANALAPSGVVEERAYLQLRDEIVAGIRQAGHLDGVCLILSRRAAGGEHLERGDRPGAIDQGGCGLRRADHGAA